MRISAPQAAAATPGPRAAPTTPAAGRIAVAPGRTETVGIPAPLALAAVILALACPNPTRAAEPSASWQSLDEITAVAEDFVRNEYADRDERITPKAGSLDPRLKLAQCPEPLEAFLPDGRTLRSRIVVGVRCKGTKPWKLYVPMQIVITDEVVTARRALPRGHVLTAADLVAEPRDVSRLATDYVTRPEELIGKRVRQPLMTGRILTRSLIEEDVVVRRGQSVTITARNQGIRIDMAGKALSDGRLNERIRVENVQSGRIVEGLVRSPEYVEVLVSQHPVVYESPKVPAVSAD